MVDYEAIGGGRFRERHRLIEAQSSVIVHSADFPFLRAEALKKKFRSACKLAVSSKNQLLTIITADRQLEFYSLKGDDVIPKYRAQLLHDLHPEFCLLEWSASQSLLVSTRSSAVLDIFEASGRYSYSIQLEDKSFDPKRIISDLKFVVSEDSDFYDVLYILQLNARLSVYKLGKNENYEVLCLPVLLGIPRGFCMALLPSRQMFVVSTEYLASSQQSPSSFTDLGLASFEMDTQKHKYVLRKLLPESPPRLATLWNVFSDNRAGIISLSTNSDESSILAVTSRGEVVLFDVQEDSSLSIRHFLLPDSDPRLQAIWTTSTEAAILNLSGTVVLDDLEAFFDGNTDGTVIEACCSLCPVAANELVAFSEEELTNAPVVSDNALLNQFWFFTLFRLQFIYKWIKVLSGAVVGQPMEDVRSDYQRSFKYVIYKLKTITLYQYVKKLLSKNEYYEAERLARSDPTFDVDIIYKQQWLDQRKNTDESLVNVLRQVKDKSWVVHECLTSMTTDVEIQRQLLDLAELAVVDLDDKKLAKDVQKAKIMFESLGEALEVTPELFHRFRGVNVLEAALYLAQEANMELLVHFVPLHVNLLRPWLLSILDFIPEAIHVSRFVDLLPTKSKSANDGIFTTDDFKSDAAGGKEFEEQLPGGLEKAGKLVISEAATDPAGVEAFIASWAEKRAKAIDETTGLVDHATAFLHEMIDKGFNELACLLKRFNFYKDFVASTSAVVLTYEKFSNMDAGELRNSILKHMNETQIRDRMLRIVELFEEFHPKTAANDVLHIASNCSQVSFAILHILWSQRRSFVSRDLLSACFSESDLKGPNLICTLEKFDFEPEITEALQLFESYDYNPTFLLVKSSTTSEESANQVVHQFLNLAFGKKDPNWIAIFNLLKKVRLLLWTEIVTIHGLLNVFASLLLTKLSKERFLGFPFHLVVDVKFKDPEKLSNDEWQTLLLTKSQEFVDRAMPEDEDDNLKLARDILSLIPPSVKPSPAITDQLRSIDVIVACIDLGCTRLPANYRFCEPEDLLREAVSTRKNYRQVKTCAELSKLLGLQPPVAKAMAYCAEQAFAVDDQSTLENYVKKLATTSKDLPVIYNVCKAIVETGKQKHLTAELVVCMLQNCPTEKLYEVSEVLEAIDYDNLMLAEHEDSDQASKHLAALNKLKDNILESIPLFPGKETSETRPGESTSSRQSPESSNPVEDDELHLDPMYADIRDLHKVHLTLPSPSATWTPGQWSASSATMATITAVLERERNPDESVALKNDTLRKAAEGLTKVVEASEVPLTEAAIQSLPTGALVHLARGEEPKTAVERVLSTGCDRERFFEDSEYREDTLLGLIMTTDRKLIEDIQEVAEKFKILTWKLHMTLIEFLLTEDDIKPVEIRNLIRDYNLRESLWTDEDNLFAALRRNVLPLLPEGDNNRLKLYLTLFRAPQPEVVFFKCVPAILKVQPGARLREILAGDERTILAWLSLAYASPDHENELKAFATFARTLPNTDGFRSKVLARLKDFNK